MDTLVRTSADEINNSLIDFIKSSFKGKKIAVHIYEEGAVDETAYLLSDPKVKKRLLESVKNVKSSVSLKEYSIRDIENILTGKAELQSL
jgi:hypothetical protein